MNQENTNYRVVQTISTPPENKTRTFLIIGIAIIVLFVVGEAGYYFYNKQMLDKQQQIQEEIKNEPLTDVSKLVNKSSSIIEQITSSAENDILKQASIDRVFAGTVDNIISTNISFENFTSEKAIAIRGTTGKVLEMHFSNEEIQKVKIIQLNPDGTTIPLSFGDIMIGDYVSMAIKDNLLNDTLESVITISVTRPK